MYLIDRLKLVRCSLLVVIWLVTKLKLLLQKKSGNLGDEVGPLNRATCTDVIKKIQNHSPLSATNFCNLQDRFERGW